jgi:hypothetical protein
MDLGERIIANALSESEVLRNQGNYCATKIAKTAKQHLAMKNTANIN